MNARGYSFGRKRRLGGRGTFANVFEEKVKEARGPLIVYAVPNKLQYARLGISISRAVGTAARRNRIKRLLRESFRLMQHDWPGGYDVVVVVRPHEPLRLAEYQKLLSGVMVRVHQAWMQRGR